MEGFAECTYLQLQTSQLFALDGGIFFDILANSTESHAHGVFISEIKCSAIKCYWDRGGNIRNLFIPRLNKLSESFVVI